MDFKGLKNINIDKKYKMAGAIIGGIFAAIYLAFLILPHLIDLNKFMPMISDEVQKISGFKISANNPKLSTTLKLGVKVKADDFCLNYKDNSPLVNLKKPEIEINLPSILIGHINLDKIKADELNAYLTFTKDKKYTVMEYADNIIKNTAPNEEAAAQKEEENQFNFPIEIKNVNVKADKIALHLLDENVNKTYLTELHNSSLLLKSLNGPLSIKTDGFIGIENSDKKFTNFDIDFKTKLPKFDTVAQNTNDDIKKDEEEFELNFNPFKTLDDFNLKSNIFVKLDIKNIDKFSAKGDINIDKFSLKPDNIELPESYLNLNFKNKDINIDSKIFVAKEEFIQTKSNITTGKKSKLNLNIKTDKITIKSLKDIASAVLNICCIKNDIKSMTASGYIKGDFDLDTDFKTIKSDGELRLINGGITIDGDKSSPKPIISLSQMRAFLDFSDNALNIKDTSALVNGAKFSVNGEIASNADINLTVKSDPLKIKDLINIATEFKLVNKKDIADFNFEDGALTVLLNVLGDFNNIQPKADIDLNNFKMTVKSLNMPLSIDDINVIARPKDKNDIDASIEIKNIKANLKEPALAFYAPNAKISADMKNIKIAPLSATLEGTKINVSGDILNYMAKPETNIKIDGNIHPNTILAFIPKEFRSNIDKRGLMPYNALISGALDNIKITGNLISNPANYISIIEIPDATGKENTLNLDMALKNDVVEINEISAKSSGVKIANIKGQIKNIYAKEPSLSNLNINIPSKTNIVIPMLSKTSMNIVGDMTLSGKAFSPDITGSVSIDTLKYPDFDLVLNALLLNFNKNILSAKANGIKTANSDFSGDALISTNFNNGIVINNLNFTSGYIDSDALIKLAEKAASTMPAPSANSASGNSNSVQSADLGIIINGGQAKIAKLKSGTLNIENISYEHTLLNNIYKLNNLAAVFAHGTVSGNCSYNVMNGKIAADMQAVNIAMKDAAKAFIGIDIVRSGTLDGTAKVTLSGATLEEQLKTLNGTVSFEVKDGEYGENISFGRFINAANVLNLTAFSNLLNSITAKVNSFNTQEFKNINGVLTFNKGVAGVSSFKSQGPNMSLYANGTYNLLNNNANLKVTGKVSSKIANTLGDLGTNKLQSTVEKVSNIAENAINKAVEKYSDNKAVQAGLAILGSLKNGASGSDASANDTEQNSANQNAGRMVTSIVKEKINPLFGNIQAGDIANIPPLSTNETENTKNFQVTISGLITNPKSIKTLKFQNDGSTNINNQSN